MPYSLSANRRLHSRQSLVHNPVVTFVTSGLVNGFLKATHYNIKLVIYKHKLFKSKINEPKQSSRVVEYKWDFFLEWAISFFKRCMINRFFLCVVNAHAALLVILLFDVVSNIKYAYDLLSDRSNLCTTSAQ